MKHEFEGVWTVFYQHSTYFLTRPHGRPLNTTCVAHTHTHTHAHAPADGAMLATQATPATQASCARVWSHGSKESMNGQKFTNWSTGMLAATLE